MSRERKYVTFETEKFHAKLVLPERYEVKRVMGRGAYGIVVECFDREENRRVAVKKVMKAFTKKESTQKRILRELLLLDHFRGHENVVELIHVIPPISYEKFDDLYLVLEFMDGDMKSVINQTDRKLTDNQIAYFLYQLLNGLKFIHSADVLHRDIKPANVLVNSELDVKICDFGLARGIDFLKDPTMSTKYVATRWYRAPELLMFWDRATKAIDIFSTGCIFAEMLGEPQARGFNKGRKWNALERKYPLTLFRGRTTLDQLTCISRVLGVPAPESICGSKKAHAYFARVRRNLERAKVSRNKIPWRHVYPDASRSALDLLDKMLAIDPRERATVEECLEHEFFLCVRDKEFEVDCPSTFDFRAAKIPSGKTYKDVAYEFCVKWNEKLGCDFSEEVVVSKDVIFVPNARKKKRRKELTPVLQKALAEEEEEEEEEVEEKEEEEGKGRVSRGEEQQEEEEEEEVYRYGDDGKDREEVV